MTADDTRGYAMNSTARKRLAEAQAELLAAADPYRCTVCGNTVPAGHDTKDGAE